MSLLEDRASGMSVCWMGVGEGNARAESARKSNGCKGGCSVANAAGAVDDDDMMLVWN